MNFSSILKDNKIYLEPEIDVTRRKIPFDVLDQIKVLGMVDKAEKQQVFSGLGSPADTFNPYLEQLKQDVKKYSVSRMLKAGYVMIKEPSKEYFPRFFNDADVKLTKKPKLVLAKLNPNQKSIFCRVGMQRYSAPIPRMPRMALDAAAKVKALTSNQAEFHLAYLPSWEKAPQLDPVLIAKVKGKYFKVAEWDGDIDLINKYLETVKAANKK